MKTFDRKKHIYNAPDIEDLLKDIIRFFNGTPVHILPPPEKFNGTGVYAIYYTGTIDIYKNDSEKNRLKYEQPIYIGKAVPSGWRQGRIISNDESMELFRRLKEHHNSIKKVENLEINDFHCRFMILEGMSSTLIGTVEAFLIRLYSPVWNSIIDGFGNHDPGKGRYQQAKSDWDVLHRGRAWADKCKGKANSKKMILKKLKGYYD